MVCTLISPSPYLSSFYMCVLVLLKLGHDGAKVRFGYQLILRQLVLGIVALVAFFR